MAHHLMVVFAAAFLIRGTGIAVESLVQRFPWASHLTVEGLENSLPLSVSRIGNSSMRRNDVIPLFHSPWREDKTVPCEKNIPDIPFEQSTDTERPDGSC